MESLINSSKPGPKDAETMANILKEMGVIDYDPKVIDLMLEFSYRYIGDVLNDAKVYSSHANKTTLDVEDIKLAIQFRMDHSFTAPPPRELLLELARHKNSQPLPPIKPYSGLNLPPERYCLYGSHFRLKSGRKAVSAGHRSSVLSVSGLRGVSQVRPSGGQAVSVLMRGALRPQVVARPPTLTVPSESEVRRPGVSVEGVSLLSDSLKRKREDDDYDAL